MSREARRAPAPVDGIDLACFELAGQLWAVAIDHVREILPTPPVTPLPDAPPLVEGLVDLRGTLIPIVDLGALLAREGPSGATRTRLVVAAVRELVIGFRVDRATQVMAVSKAELEPVPELVKTLGCRLVSAAVRRPDRSPTLVLDLEMLLARVLGAAAGGVGDEEVAA